jgi:hypothetical protein
MLKSQKNMSFYEPRQYENYGGVAMMMKGLERAWSRQSLIVFGDVFYTEDAVKAMVEPAKTPDWNWKAYGRKTDNLWTGTPWGEFFGFRTSWAVREDMKAAAADVQDDYEAGRFPRSSPWEWYFRMEGMSPRIADVKNVAVGPHWVDINDLTDDIDYERDVVGLQNALARK